MSGGDTPTSILSTNFQAIEFDAIPGWPDDNHSAALSCFLRSAERMALKPYFTKAVGVDAGALADIAAIAIQKFAGVAEPSDDEARVFFEEHFRPCSIGNHDCPGFVTAYYEPVLPASETRSERFKYPLYKRPDDLIDVDDSTRPHGMDRGFMFARSFKGKVEPYFDRHQINRGAIEGRSLELFWLDDPIEVFFIHIQGSARLKLSDGSIRRVSYAAKTGHPYTSIGKYLTKTGALPIEDVTMTSIKRWLRTNPDSAFGIVEQNRSFIFFKEVDQPDLASGPVAAAGVALTPGRSLAIDHRLHTFGTPIFVTTDYPLPQDASRFSKLMIAQDTGSAIVGASRGDLFMGSGELAGEIAGSIKCGAEFTILVPRSQLTGAGV